MPGDRLPLFCSAPDVAQAHVKALSVPDAGGKRFLLCGGAFNWGAAAHYIAEKYPQLKSRLPQGWEEAPSKGYESYAHLDTTFATDLLGLQFESWQHTLDVCIQDLLHLEKLPQWQS